jgi:hypothetical protein
MCSSNPSSRGLFTWGRWSKDHNGKAHFVCGVPDPTDSKHSQPVLELYSWKEFLSSGKFVRV